MDICFRSVLYSPLSLSTTPLLHKWRIGVAKVQTLQKLTFWPSWTQWRQWVEMGIYRRWPEYQWAYGDSSAVGADFKLVVVAVPEREQKEPVLFSFDFVLCNQSFPALVSPLLSQDICFHQSRISTINGFAVFKTRVVYRDLPFLSAAALTCTHQI